MSLSKWIKTLAINDDTNVTYNNLVKKTAVEVDTFPNSYSHSYGNFNTVKINSDGTKEAGIHFIYDGLEIGDMLEIEAEVRVLSGASPILKVAEYNTTTLSEANPLKKTFALTSEWQMIRLKGFVAFPSNFTGFRAFVGLEAGQAGIFEVRSCRATAHTKAIQLLDKVDRGFYRYILKKVAGVWTMQNGSSLGATVEEPNTWSLNINFPIQAYPSIHIDSNLSSQYIFGFSIPSATKVTLNCRNLDDTTSSRNDWTLIPDGTVLYVTVFYKY